MTYGKLEDGNVTICRSSERPSDGEWYPIRFKVPPGWTIERISA